MPVTHQPRGTASSLGTGWGRCVAGALCRPLTQQTNWVTARDLRDPRDLLPPAAPRLSRVLPVQVPAATNGVFQVDEGEVHTHGQQNSAVSMFVLSFSLSLCVYVW